MLQTVMDYWGSEVLSPPVTLGGQLISDPVTLLLLIVLKQLHR